MARDAYRQAFAGFQRLGQTAGMVYPLLGLAEMDEEEKRFADARDRYAAALALTLQAANPFLEAHARTGLAVTAERLGDRARARAERQKALVLWTRLGDEKQAEKTRQALASLGPAGT